MTHTATPAAAGKTRVLGAASLAALVLTISALHRGDSIAQIPRDCPGVSICNPDASRTLE